MHFADYWNSEVSSLSGFLSPFWVGRRVPLEESPGWSSIWKGGAGTVSHLEPAALIWVKSWTLKGFWAWFGWTCASLRGLKSLWFSSVNPFQKQAGKNEADVNELEDTKRFGETGLRFLSYCFFLCSGFSFPHRGVVLVITGGALCQTLFIEHALSHLILIALLGVF